MLPKRLTMRLNKRGNHMNHLQRLLAVTAFPIALASTHALTVGDLHIAAATAFVALLATFIATERISFAS